MAVASLEFRGVSHIYAGTGRDVRALDSLGLAVDDGEPVAVIGPSGCGKSTMLLLAAGMLTPSEGEVLVAGSRVEGPRLKTALILQEYGLLPWKTALHNAALGLEIRGLPRGEVRERALASLDRVGLAEFADVYPGELSGGMRQRLGLARALALDADLLLMDEPLSALDALTREDLQDVLLELWRSRGHAAVLVTHSIEEAVFLGRRIIVMSPRPGTVAALIDNAEMGERSYRNTSAFYEQCARVRTLLAEEGAVGAVIGVTASEGAQP